MSMPSTPNVTEQLRQIVAGEPGLLDTLANAGSPDAALQVMAAASARTGLPIDLDAARALMARAEAGQATDAVPLTDSELAEVAGGRVVNGGSILNSILSLGLGCAIVSIIEAAKQRDCGAVFHS